MRKHYLNSVFDPASVAVVCDPPRCGLADQLLSNLEAGDFPGPVYRVMADGGKIAGKRASASLEELEAVPEQVVAAVAPERLPALLRQCGELGVGAVVVLSGGFNAAGEQGQALRAELSEIARSSGVALVGPRSVGVVRTAGQFNASTTRSQIARGKVALVTQSGSFNSALLDWADAAGFGFSTVVSLGEAFGVKLGDVLDYLAQDPNTGSILLYVERISAARRFISGLRAAARLKPVVVIKSARNELGERAAISHAHARLGSDVVFDAVIRRAGAVRVSIVAQMFAATTILASGARAHGTRLAVVTNGGAPGVMAADWVGSTGLDLAELTPESLAAMQEEMPPHWTAGNPVDLLGDATPERYRLATATLLADKGVDGVLVLLTPQGLTRPKRCAEAVIEAAAESRKPVLTSWLGEKLVSSGRAALVGAGIPHFASPEAAVDAFGYLAAYRHNQGALLQVPEPLSTYEDPDIYGARAIIDNALADGRQQLSDAEVRAVLRAFRIPVLHSVCVNSPSEALIAAENAGLPVAMKIASPDIAFKTEVGGVRLGVRDARAVQRSYDELLQEVAEHVPDARIDGVVVESMVLRPHARELKVGISRDPVFGPVIHLGAAGSTVEMLIDQPQVALPPLNDFLARDLIARTPAARVLREYRTFPEADLACLSMILQRVSEIACELPMVTGLDINPLLVDEHGAIVVSARITVAVQPPGGARYGHMAIHPYPSNLEGAVTLADGREVMVRPIRPEDARSEESFVAQLSAETKFMRFMHGLDRLTPSMLVRFTQIDYDRELALIALQPGEEDERKFIGVARYVTNPDGLSCEFALTIADEWQSQGLGPRMMERLMEVAGERGLQVMMGEVLAQNYRMQRMCKRLGFKVARSPEDPEVVIVSRPL